MHVSSAAKAAANAAAAAIVSVIFFMIASPYTYKNEIPPQNLQTIIKKINAGYFAVNLKSSMSQSECPFFAERKTK